MNGTSDFQDVRSSASRSPSYPSLYEHQYRYGTGASQLLPTHDLIILFTGISKRKEQVSETFFMNMAPQVYSWSMPQSFPYSHGFFILTPIDMTAEKASEVILADAKQGSTSPVSEV